MSVPEFENYHTVQSKPGDLENIFSFFDSAIAYQKANHYDLWPQFGREMIEAEIAEGKHWKVVEGDAIACVFSVLYNDPVIWKERDLEPAVYLHRIAINPLFKGRGMMKHIRHWAMQHAKENNKLYVRMDTWGNNETLRNYYISCGFHYIGQQQLHNTAGLPAHYGGNYLSLFEVKV